MPRAGAWFLGAAVAIATFLPAASANAHDRYERYRRAWASGGDCGCDVDDGCGCGGRDACACDGSTRGHCNPWWGRSRCWRSRDGCGVYDGATCAQEPARSGQRIYTAPRWSSLVYGSRRWQSWAYSDATATASESPIVPETPEAPAIPLGERPAAHEALFRGDAEAAAKGFEGLLEKDPTDAAAWTGLLHARFLGGDFPGATQALRQAANWGGVSPAGRFDLPAAYADVDKFRGRLLGLRARVRFVLEDDGARLLLAYFESGLGETEDARLDAKQVLASLPNDPAAKALLGN